MKIYCYDPDTKFFLCEGEADADPVVQEMINERNKRLHETYANANAISYARSRNDTPVLPYPGAADPNEIPVMQPEYLIPAFATQVAPPAVIPAGKGALWIETAWTLVDLPKTPVVNASTGESTPQDFVAPEGVPQAQVDAAHQLWASKLLQAHLDAVANGLGYDDIKSIVSYADEPADPTFQAEGQAARRWRSLFWRAAIEKLAAVRAGTVRAPVTREELLAGLPEYVAPGA